LPMQTIGDCRMTVCDGNGASVEVFNNADVVDDGNPCTDDVCNAGVSSHPPKSVGTPCSAGGTQCNGVGACVECIVASDCPGMDTTCQTRACNQYQCGMIYAAAGTLLPSQITGDCRNVVCDGFGATIEEFNDADSVDDGNPCTDDICTAGTLSHPPKSMGSPCSIGGTLCNGSGTCVECIAASDCPGVDDTCQTRTCNQNQCGMIYAALGTPLPTQTAGDCKLNVCNGQGAINAAVDDSDTPPDDGDPCTDPCVNGVPNATRLECLDPSLLAPPLDPTVVSTFPKIAEFLYSGSTPIQLGVAPGTIEARRVAVIRGKAFDRNDQPLPGVTISILGHNEFGHSSSRLDGVFDIAVNGGGFLTVEYTKPGFLPVQRTVQTPWQDFIDAPDVVMIPLDPQATTIDLSVPQPMQAARGSVVTDADGTRQATLLFPQGTTAEVVLPNGTTQSLTTLTVRATEYTVGTNGPKAMPGPLPATSGYTYASEYSVDEAMAMNAKTVQFSQPVIQYVDNFLDFPVGQAVPVGYYDRERATWVPANNGRVVKIHSITNSVANLDIDGSGNAANAAALATLGVTPEEQTKLATLYSVGATLWRVKIDHFTPWDCNWPVKPPDDAKSPQNPDPQPENPDPPEKPDCATGSIIECQSQALGESVPILGTPFSLHYKSNRTSGYDTKSLRIQVTGTSVPTSLKRVELIVSVGGRTTTALLPGAANQSYTFHWNGLDGYGRQLYGTQKVEIRVGYVYPAQYVEPGNFDRSFAQYGATLITGNRADMEITLWQNVGATLGNWQAPAMGLNGWTLNAQHATDPNGQILHLGSGRRQESRIVTGQITTIAGTGVWNYGGDGGPATSAYLNAIQEITTDAQGNLYIVDTANNRIRKVTPQGIITTFAGNGQNGFSGDGGPATNAKLATAWGIAFDHKDSIYITTIGDHRIRKVDRNGIITTVAGIGQWGFSGDGGPATQAQLNSPYAVTVDSAGVIWFTDQGTSRIRTITPDGIIRTIAGNGQGGTPNDGTVVGPSTAMTGIWGLQTDTNGTLYVAMNNRLRKIGLDRVVTTVAGTGACGGAIPDSGIATAVGICPGRIYRDVHGSFFLTEQYRHGVHKVTPGGMMLTVAGMPLVYGFSGDGGPAKPAILNSPFSIALDAGGNIFVADRGNGRVRIIAPGFSGVGLGDTVLTSKSGSERYLFDSIGHHVSTFSTATNTELHHFTYNPNGYVTTITDADGNVTTIARDANNEPISITAPDGQQTVFTRDANGYLASITNSANETWHMTYSANGLMQSFQNPRGHTSTMTYSPSGQLSTDQNAAGGAWNLSRTGTNDDYTVTKSSTLGRTTQYRVERLTTGDTRRTNTAPTGDVSLSLHKTDGTKETTDPDGTIRTIVEGPDPRFHMQSPIVKSATIKMPSGLTLSATATRTATLSNPNDLTSLTSQTDTVTINGKTATRVYTAATHSTLLTSPLGRQEIVETNAKGKPIQVSIPGLAPLEYTYDARGRIETMTQATVQETRTTTFAYDAAGWLESVTDPLGRVVMYDHDAAGRVTTETLPDLRQIAFGYDANGNITSITPPGQPAHSFGYTPTDLVAQYTPPTVAGVATPETLYLYNLDKQLTTVTRPDGQIMGLTYDATSGRLTGLTAPQGSYGFTYLAGNRVNTISAPGNVGHGFSWNGPLFTSHTLSGPVAGAVSYTYDTNFRVDTVTAAGTVVDYGYDDDGLLTSAAVSGSPTLSLARNAQNGLLTGTTLGTTNDAWTYNAFAEPTLYEAKTGGTTRFSQSFVRDALGRITQKTETTLGTTHVFDYAYDLAGRLDTVTLDGVLAADYGYDDNGNRTGLSGANAGLPGGCFDGSGMFGATYDAQDRMLSYGACSYQYTPNGELTQKTQGNAVTTYQYDVFGNLRHAVLLTGTQLDYVIDGMNRRIGKKVNGALVQGFLYVNQLEPIAELDGSGNVVSVFVYADRGHVPSAMIKGGTTYRIVSDHLGSVRLVMDAAMGTVVQQMDYDAFGNVLIDTNPGFQPFGYAGGIYDRDLQLMRFGARDYDPETGRWTAKDRVRIQGDGTNLYEYVGGNPVSFVDPLGRWRWPDYATFQLDLYVFSVSATYTRHGDVFFGGGVGRAYPNPVSYGVSISDGWLNKSCPTQEEINTFLDGFSQSVGAYYFVGGSVSANQSGRATNVGVGFGIGVNPGSLNSYQGNIIDLFL